MRTTRVFAISFSLIIFGSGTPALAADWLQFGYDQSSSSRNGAETGYSTAANAPVYSVGLTSGSDSTPIYLSNVTTAAGTKNLLFITAGDGTLFAIDSADGSVVWQQQPTGGGSFMNGAPAIDPGRLYVYAYGLDGYVHKYQVGNGKEATTGGWPELSTKKPDVEKGASGLSIASPSTGGNYLYAVMNGYGGDAGDYQGHITAINLATGAQNVFNSQCSNLFIHFVENGTAGSNDCDLEGPDKSYVNGEMSGIWGRPGAIFDYALNRIFIATGNGLFDANATTGRHYEWGDSVLELKVDGTGSGGGLPMDSFTPTTYVTLYDSDIDLGSTSPALLPSTSAKYPHLAVQSGKDGCVRIINLGNMSGASGPAHVGGELNAATSCTTDAVGNEVRTQPAVWVNPADGSTWFFIATDGGFFGFKLVFDGSGNPSLTQPLASVLSLLPGGTSPVLANNEIYYITYGSPSLLAVDAATGDVLWGDSSPGNIHWQSPIVVDGHIYLVDGNGVLYAYALDGIFRNGFQ